MKTRIFGISTSLRMGSFTSTLLPIFLSKIFLSPMALGVPLWADDEPVLQTPDFTTTDL